MKILTFFVTMAFTAGSDIHLRSKRESITEGQNEFIDWEFHGKSSVEKGMKCDGCWGEKGAGKKCSGGMKANFEIGVSADSIMSEIGQVLASQMEDFIPSKDDLSAGEDSIDALVAMDEILEGAEDGFSRTMEFGGFMKAGK